MNANNYIRGGIEMHTQKGKAFSSRKQTRKRCGLNKFRQDR